LLAAGADADLRSLVLELVLALELAHDGRLELGNAVDRGIARMAGVDGAFGGRADVLRRIEVGLAGAEPDDVAAAGFELARLVRHRDGGRRLHARQHIRKKGHDVLQILRLTDGEVAGRPSRLPGSRITFPGNAPANSRQVKRPN